MKQVYENVMKVFDADKANGKVWVNYFDNVQQALEDGFYKEILDEDYFIFGNPEATPSELEEPFIIIEVEAASNLPIFIEESKDDVIHYLEDHHKEYMK